jgi:hypothetical protein
MQYRNENAELESVRRNLAVLHLQLDQVRRLRAARKFNPDQPRVPAGDPEGGPWTGGEDGSGADDSDDAQLERVLFDPRRFVIQRGIQAALSLFAGLSAQNGADQQAIISFNATEFRSQDGNSLPIEAVGQLTREQVDRFCKKFDDVQTRTDETYARIARERPLASASQLGTAVHVNLKEQINNMKNPFYQAEVSRLKSDEARYSKLGSIRIDALEKSGDDTVCVYDIKTGTAGLTKARSLEIATTAFSVFGPVSRIIVTEVRPRR